MTIKHYTRYSVKRKKYQLTNAPYISEVLSGAWLFELSSLKVLSRPPHCPYHSQKRPSIASTVAWEIPAGSRIFMSFYRRSNPTGYRSTAAQYKVWCGGGAFPPGLLRYLYPVSASWLRCNEQEHAQPPPTRGTMASTAHRNAQLHNNQAVSSGRAGWDNRHIYTRGPAAQGITPSLPPVNASKSTI